jgi:hypothetical protein
MTRAEKIVVFMVAVIAISLYVGGISLVVPAVNDARSLLGILSIATGSGIMGTVITDLYQDELKRKDHGQEPADQRGNTAVEAA